jgi:hypothetical protein
VALLTFDETHHFTAGLAIVPFCVPSLEAITNNSKFWYVRFHVISSQPLFLGRSVVVNGCKMPFEIIPLDAHEKDFGETLGRFLIWGLMALQAI